MKLNHKKILEKIILSFLFIAIGIFSNKMCDIAKAEEIKGSVYTDIHEMFPLSETDPKILEDLKSIDAESANVTVSIANGIIDINTYRPASDEADLEINGQKVNVKNGQFIFKDDSKNTKLNYKIKDKNTMPDSGTAVPDKDGNVKIMKIYDFDTVMESMDGTSSDLLRAARYKGQVNGEKVKPGTHVHCNRFNGPKSDKHYYSRRSSGKGYLNWWESDCCDKWYVYGCPLLKPDTKCDGLLKSHPHDCSVEGGWPVTCWYRN